MRRCRPLPLVLLVGALACGRRREAPGKADGSAATAMPAVDSGGEEPGPLAVVSPAAGDVWEEGRTYTIRWRAAGLDRLNVGVALGGKDKGHLALGLPAGRDSLEWRVPEGFVSGFGIDRSDDVRVRIEDARDPTRSADSSPFTVVAPARKRH